MEEKIKLVLIEDEEITSKIIGEELTESGFDVIKAFDGEQGLKVANSQAPDLILLDVMMPKMIGFDVLKALKANSKTKDIPVFMLTVASDDESVKTGFELGAQDYIIKSKHAVAEISQKIREFLASKRQ